MSVHTFTIVSRLNSQIMPLHKTYCIINSREKNLYSYNFIPGPSKTKKPSSPVQISRQRRVSFNIGGFDNPGLSIMTEDIDSEEDSGYGELFTNLGHLKHKDSIVSCGSFEREDFLSLLKKEDTISIISREDQGLRKIRTFSLLDEYEQADNRFKAYLYNRFGSTGSEQGQLRNGTGIYHIYNGTVIVTDVLNSSLLVYSGSGRLVKTIQVGKRSEPWTAAATPSGAFAVTLSREKCISVMSCAGIEKLRFGEDVLEYPSGVIVDRRNRYIVSDIKQNKIHIFSDKGELIRTIPEDDESSFSLKSPRHVTLSHSGNIVVSDSGHHCIRLFDRHGDHIKSFGKYGSNDGELKFPHGVCTDHEDNIIVADYYNNRVSMFSSEGKFVQHIVTAHMGIKRPQAVTIRFFQNNYILFVTYGDSKANKVVAYRIVDSENEHIHSTTASV